MSIRLRGVGLVIVVATATLAARRAEACGGLFCSSANPVAVEQNAERILFTQNSDATFSAYVEIQYVGDPRAFSWVIPVPETPELGVVPASTLQVLDLLTRPTVVSPPRQCSSPFQGESLSGGIGCGAAAPMSFDSSDGVHVETLERVGPYEPTVVSAEDSSLIFDWLNGNGYLLTPQMRPYITKYASEGMKFLALRLAPDAGTADIAPIKMTYATPCPMVPLALTAVSAEPEMSVLVMFLGPTRMRAANYQNLEIEPDDVRMDALSRSNYYALVSHKIDVAGGRAFVTELSGQTSAVPPLGPVSFNAPDFQESSEAAGALLAEHRVVTRLFSRLSAWEMTLDPEFEASDGGAVSNVFDLSTRPPVEVCGADPGVRCGSVYCGPGSHCGVNAAGDEGCVCGEGFVARAVSEPDLVIGSRPSVACQRRDFAMFALEVAAGPCSTYSCGTGECVVTNGFPTCLCAAGELARRDGDGMVCEPAVRTFDADQLVWNEGSQGCAVGSGFGWTVFALLAVARRRRSPA